MSNFNLQEQLETFRQHYPLRNVNVEKEFMVYNIANGKAYDEARKANDLIAELKLNLRAVNSNKVFGNRLLIQEKR